jgi:TolB-like protein
VEAKLQNGEASPTDGGVAPRVSPDQVRTELARMLASRTFQGSERQRKFLSYVVDETIEGRANLLKEYSIGIEVFAKDDSFDPRIDTIVRVEARKLRSRIAKYYQDEGKHDAIRIGFVKGSYAPVFQDAVAEELEPHIAVLTPDRESKPGVRGERTSRWWAIATLCAVVFVAGAVFFLYQRSQHQSPGVASIAVLPFANLGDEQNEFFSDGLTDELIDALGRVPGLRVVGRTSAFQLKGKTRDLREIGRELNVTSVLEGSVRQSGTRLRITAELDDTSNGYRLWSQSYDRDLKDAIAIQREISNAITERLGSALMNSGTPNHLRLALSSTASVNSEAYQDYLRGRYFWNRSTLSNVNKAIESFQRSIAEDPNYALSYVGLAGCYVAIPRHLAVSTRDLAPKIRAAANKALELDGTLGEAHLDLAEAHASEFEWKAAEEEFRKGLELSPGSAVGHRWYSTFLGRVGRLEESLKEAQLALQLDPVSLIASFEVGQSLYGLRRYDDAIDQFNKTLAMDPNYGFARIGRGMTLLQTGKLKEGVADLQLASQLLEKDPRSTSALGYAYAVSGDVPAARAILNDFLKQAMTGHFRAALIADIYVGLRDKNAALDWLGKSIDEGDSPALKEQPAYDLLRSDPRFPKLLARMKLR